MAAVEPWRQLDELCRGHGATPERIRKLAPFLLELPAVREAAEEVMGSADADPAHAAVHLLLCITKPNGAAELDEKNSIFARSCLGLNNTQDLYTRRLGDLVNNEKYRFPTSVKTQNEYCLALMSSITAKLLQLNYYPCGPLDLLGKKIALMVELVFHRDIGELFERPAHERAAAWDIASTYLSRSIGAASEKYPKVSPVGQFSILVAAIIDGSYRRLYLIETPEERASMIPAEALHRWLFPVGHEQTKATNRQVRKSLMRVVDLMFELEQAGSASSLLLHRVPTRMPNGGFSMHTVIRGSDRKRQLRELDDGAKPYRSPQWKFPLVEDELQPREGVGESTSSRQRNEDDKFK